MAIASTTSISGTNFELETGQNITAQFHHFLLAGRSKAEMQIIYSVHFARLDQLEVSANQALLREF